MAFQRFYLATFPCVVILTLLAGCGGGGGGSSSNVTGRVIDGYIRGAVVCVDVNGNLQCDAGEPTGESGPGGVYTIDAGFDVSGYNVIAEVGVGAEDEEEGPVTAAYSLAAPAVGEDVMVTPLTTLVSIEIAADGDSSKSFDEKLADARTSVGLTLGVDNVLGVNFVEDTTKAELKKMARVVAVAVQEIQSTLVASGSNDVGDDADLIKDFKKNAFKEAVKSVKDQVLPSAISGGSVIGDLDAVVATVKTSSNTIATGKVQTIVANTKAGAPKPADVKELLAQGTFLGGDSDGIYKDASGTCSEYDNEFELDLLKLSGDTLISERRVFINNQTFETCKNAWVDYTLSSEGWFAETEGIPAKFTFPEGAPNCIQFPAGDKATMPVWQACFAQRDLSGKVISETILGLCEDLEGDALVTCKAAKFESGSIAFDVTFSVTEDLLTAWVIGSDGTTLNTFYEGTLEEFITSKAESKDGLGSFMSVDARISSLTKDSSGKPSAGTLQWFEYGQSAEDSDSTEESSFTIKKIQGKEVMVIDLPRIYRLQDNYADEQQRMFVYLDKTDIPTIKPGVYSGEVVLSAVKQSVDFVNPYGQKFGTLKLLESALKATGQDKPTYPWE